MKKTPTGLKVKDGSLTASVVAAGVVSGGSGWIVEATPSNVSAQFLAQAVCAYVS